jgi:hypothetical protein
MSEKPKYITCPRCERFLLHTSDNFCRRPKNKLDRICRLCRSEVASKAQYETNDYFNEMRKKIIEDFNKNKVTGMEKIISEVLTNNKKPVKVGKVYEIKREEADSDICESAFAGASGKSEYYLKFNIVTKEIIVFHKNIRKNRRDSHKHIKEEFWKKWNPSRFCTFQDQEKLKFELMKDLDMVLDNHKGKLDQIDWGKIISLNKSPFERTL